MSVKKNARLCDVGCSTTIYFTSTYDTPTPSGIIIDMMPFISSEEFKTSRLPENLKPYWSLIKRCVEHAKGRNSSSLGSVFYLSIEESEVEKGSSQRRPGLHVDRPGKVNIADFEVSFTYMS